MTIIEVDNISHHYTSSGMTDQTRTHQVLSKISMKIEAGETLALLGKSGCGKSTLARLLCGLEKPAAGEVLFQGKNIHHLNGREQKAFRQQTQMVFQDAVSAANPRKSVDYIIREPLRHLTKLSVQEQTRRVVSMLKEVELDESCLSKSPLQLSGGQLQRVCLARALVVRPRLVILDESVSNLDLVLQANIIALLAQLREKMNIAFLFITHDLRLVKHFCQRVMVMDEGKITESVLVTPGLEFTSSAGIELQRAVLPAFPVRRQRLAN